MGESNSSDRMKETGEDSPEAVELPEWLTDTVGLGSDSPKQADSGSVSKSEQKSLNDRAEGLSDDELLLEWLDEAAENGDELPLAAKELVSSEDPIEQQTVDSVASAKEETSTSSSNWWHVGENEEAAEHRGETTKSTEDAMSNALEDPGIGQDDERDDLDGELKWLEELAASQDSSDDSILGAGRNLDSLGVLPDEDFIPDWLRADLNEETSNQELSSLYASETVGVDVPDLRQEGKTVPSQDVPDWLIDQMGDESRSGEDDNADVDWFNQIIAGDESAIDELLEIQAQNLVDDSPAVDTETTIEEPSWLRELEMLETAGGKDLEPETDQEEITELSVEPGLFEQQPLDSPAGEEEEVVLAPEDVPADPEEAMAWLEQLAFDQGVAGDELTEEVSDLVPDEFMEAALERGTVGDDYESSDLATEVPDDPDEAMDWLERLAAEQGASEDELMTFVGDSEIGAQEVSADVEVDEEFETALSQLAEIEMPADSTEALFWLNELALGFNIETEEGSAPDDEVHTLLEEPVIEAEPDEVQMDQKVPDAMEAAVIAAMMSEAAGVLEEESEIKDEMDAIDGSIEDTLIGATFLAEEAIESFEVDEVDEIEVAEDDILAVDELDSEEEIPMIVLDMEDEVDLEPHVAGEVATEADDNLDDDEDDLAWLDSLDEANVTGWLVAEEAMLAEEQDSGSDSITSPVESELVFAPEEKEVPDAVNQDAPAEELEEKALGEPSLSTAQAALRSGQITEALNSYSVLVDSGESLPYVIADLEGAVETYRDEPGFMKLLGDAYSRNGQLQKAIEVYRQALSNL